MCWCVMGAIGAIRKKIKIKILIAPIAPITHQHIFWNVLGSITMGAPILSAYRAEHYPRLS